MQDLCFQGRKLSTTKGENLLECLLRHGVQLPHSCRSGICQSCLVQVKAGPVLKEAQKGLRLDQIEQGLVCACQQPAIAGLEITSASEGQNRIQTEILKQERLSDSVVQVTLKPLKPFTYRGGQFINLRRADQLSRSYSIANKTDEKELLIQIRRIENGRMSTWLFDQNLKGELIEISGPIGSCYYRGDEPSRDLLLAGTGTGLAPLYAILLDALRASHPSRITLIHGARDQKGLYLVEKLRNLELEYSQFQYIPCVLEDDSSDLLRSSVVDVVKKAPIRPKETIAFLCGDPGIVKALKREIFLKGVASSWIFSDPFVPSSP